MRALRFSWRDQGTVHQDSYGGTAWHDVAGASNRLAAEIWPGSRIDPRRGAASSLSPPAETARPLLDADGNMRGGRVRPVEHVQGYTEKLDWDLAPSASDSPDILGRGGSYIWEHVPTTKGVHRVQAAVFNDTTPQHPFERSASSRSGAGASL